MKHSNDADLEATYNARERDEAAHTVSIWYSNKRGTGKRRLVAMGWPTGRKPGTTYVVHAPINHGMISRPQYL